MNRFLIARDPFLGLRSMRDEMDQWFENMFALPEWNAGAGGDGPVCDIEESENEYVLNLDVPGVKKEDLRVHLDGNVLTVSGRRRDEKKEGTKKTGFRSQRFFGEFTRSFTLPPGIQAEGIQADYSDGALCLKIPKGALTQAKNIEIGERRTDEIGERRTEPAPTALPKGSAEFAKPPAKDRPETRPEAH